jgi:hypothetical protein
MGPDARGIARPLAFLLVSMFALGGLAACSAPAATPGATPGSTGLPAGTYASTAFQPQVTFTVPAGWAIRDDTERYFALQPAISDLVGIYLFRGPLPAVQDPSCPTTAASGVGTTSGALSGWIQALPGLAVSAPRLAAVGGLDGVELDIQVAAGWTTSCPYANGLPAVPLFVDPATDFRWTVAGTEKLRLALLDGRDGTTVAVDIDAFDGALMPDLLAAAAPIVRSMAFKAG